MLKCELYIWNETYDMFKEGKLIDDKNEYSLESYCNVDLDEDTTIVYNLNEKGESKEIVYYIPHGNKNQEKNKINVLLLSCDELIVYNETKEKLLVNNKELEKGEKLVFKK